MTNEEVLVALASLIGTPYTETVKGQIATSTGRTRVAGPTDITTKEFDESRIHVVTDGNDVIEGFRFG